MSDCQAMSILEMLLFRSNTPRWGTIFTYISEEKKKSDVLTHHLHNNVRAVVSFYA